MAEEGTLAINADIEKMAGANANSTALSEAYTNFYIKKAEGMLSAAAKYDWVTNYASVSTIGKEILKDAVASYAAFKAVDYDSTAFLSTEYTTKINSLWASFQKIYQKMETDANYKTFILTGEGDID